MPLLQLLNQQQTNFEPKQLQQTNSNTYSTKQHNTETPTNNPTIQLLNKHNMHNNNNNN